MDKPNYPLILVFYVDAEMAKNAQIIHPFIESVNLMIQQKDANMMAFFLPTNGKERIECINPIMVQEADMAKVNQIVQDLTKSFDIGGVDIDADTDIGGVKVVNKPCECGNNPDGDCKCD